MSPTIRIDNDVWSWLKSLAVPFEDTPNSVLRRVAGLDGHEGEIPAISFTPPRIHDLRTHVRPPVGGVAGVPASAPSNVPSSVPPRVTPSTPQHPPQGRRVTGEWLNKTFHLHAAHALYHKDGEVYERFTQFPGVLCDARGCVRFETEDEFTGDPHLTIGTKVNVPGGIAQHPRYQPFPRPER